ncbi:MAG: hypothetical protein KC422_01270 [Trueperaceae bacterium]|nr:hypothetical protein [Trueperaceae bacterium]
MSYKALDTDKIVTTVEILGKRIHERFPNSGLYRVSQQLLDIAFESRKRTAEIKEPIMWVRALNVFFIVLIILTLLGSMARFRLGFADLHFFDFIQALEAGINDVVLIGAGVFFLITLEQRIKRTRALKALHELRSVAHVIDMHQLTKDPERLLSKGDRTASSPKASMSPYELGRYLDYCSEMLSLTGKLAALYMQDFDDSVVLQSVNEIEDLTTGLSQKIWQKLVILHESTLGSEA